MTENQWFRRGDKKWLREFSEKNGITFKQLKTVIFPTTSARTLESLWQMRRAANSTYADALIWYAKAINKEWNSGDTLGC